MDNGFSAQYTIYLDRHVTYMSKKEISQILTQIEQNKVKKDNSLLIAGMNEIDSGILAYSNRQEV